MNDPVESAADYQALARCRDLEYLLLGDLRQWLEEPQTEQTRRAVLLIVDHLLEHLPYHLHLQSQGGYMADVLEQFPNWDSRIEQLHKEDVRCLEVLRELRERIARESPSAGLTRKMCRCVVSWMRALAAHRRRETQLLQEALTLDIGGEA